jgi:hypothetical protein
MCASCGIEEYYYLPAAFGASQSAANKGIVNLYGISYSYFLNFRIYYRIYVSDYVELAPGTGNFSQINPTLTSDYSAFLTYINAETQNTNMGTVFSGRKYYPLEVQGTNLDQDLLNVTGGGIVNLDFSDRKNPTIQVNGGTEYTLYRSTGDGVFNPRPNRLFINDPELYAASNINDTTNADVVNTTSTSPDRYTYAAFYIVAVGMDTNFSPIYSKPGFIGVLKLPEPF